MSEKRNQDQEPITFTDEQNEAIRKGFAGLEAGEKGFTPAEARALARKRTKEWQTQNTGRSATG